MIAAEPSSTERSEKLYVVTREDLSSGYQTTQVAHAVADFTFELPATAELWHERSNSLVILAVKDERALTQLEAEASRRGLHTVAVREPDLGDELTALAFAPGTLLDPEQGKQAVRFLSNLPLVGKVPGEQALLRERERRMRKLSDEMRATEQTKGQDVLQHGRSVREHYRALTQHLRGELDLSTTLNWRLPSWVEQYREELRAALPDTWVMDRYLTMHDCGKPAVRIVDEDGRAHYPGHAEASTRVYREVYGSMADEDVAWFIAHDMDLHLAKAADLPELAQDPRVVGCLLAAFAEVTSNAGMFGGIDSTGYKVKHKHLESRGRALCKLLFGEK